MMQAQNQVVSIYNGNTPLFEEERSKSIKFHRSRLPIIFLRQSKRLQVHVRYLEELRWSNSEGSHKQSSHLKH